MLIEAKSRDNCRRCGVLAVKAGMTQEWDQWGARVPLTVLWIDDCQASHTWKRHELCNIFGVVLGWLNPARLLRDLRSCSERVPSCVGGASEDARAGGLPCFAGRMRLKATQTSEPRVRNPHLHVFNL